MIRLVLSHGGEFSHDNNSWNWNGTKTTSLLVKRNIKYKELLDKVIELLQVDCSLFKVVMKFKVPGMSDMSIPPAEICKDDDVDWYISVYQQTPLCVSTIRMITMESTQVVEVGTNQITVEAPKIEWSREHVSDAQFNQHYNNEGNFNAFNSADHNCPREPGPVNQLCDIDDVHGGIEDDCMIGVDIISDNHDGAHESADHASIDSTPSAAQVGSTGGSSIPFDATVESGIDTGDVQVNKLYKSKKELQTKLHMLALRKNFEFKVKKSNKNIFTVICINDDCQWRLRATKLRESNFFLVRKFSCQHTCSSDFGHNSHRQASSWVIGRHIMQKLREPNQSLKPASIIDFMRQEFGINISYQKARKAVEHALELIRGSPEESYQKLASYCYILEKNNPGTTTCIETDSENRFMYFFLTFGPSIRGFHSFMRHVVCVNSTYLKSKYRGTLLSATCQDGNIQMYPIAWGIVESENDASWLWFMLKLREQIGESDQLVFVSDQNNSIASAIKTAFPQSHHGYCMGHMENNIKSKFHTTGILSLFKSAAQAYCVSEFQSLIGDIYRKNETVGTYLEDTGFEYWSRAHFKANRYNIMKINNVESLNSLLKHQRDYPITALIEHIRTFMQQWFFERRTEAEECMTPLTPRLEDDFRKKIDATAVLQVQPVTLYEFHVGMDTNMHVVNLAEKSCTCKEFDLLQLPCEHALVVSRLRGVALDTLCSPYYTTLCWREAYAEPIHPVDNEKDWQIPEEVRTRVILPPSMR
ncbi:uncharacterized protein LOC111398915 [Olea europaea var. sylvestris]|uniref:Uncharacterized protein LOC111398915 n=1 Tax=Olea europaea subsp. europaea TaxID=158383 RepID=A0A8S0U3D2_OLEEU|nr:uncharacterized protein LOC111398915 [Olea europaea var. sylvestris]XP_022881843.1 uncharacterized protein LOC111398915 [Olea europaea var. sylvestris]CAA3012848.1 uncharacterized protein LOC111398915 [Olea europaea subsp. europaea]